MNITRSRDRVKNSGEVFTPPELVNEMLDKVIADSNIPFNKIIVAGIELPGLINLKQGINKTYFPNIDNLFEELRKIPL